MRSIENGPPLTIEEMMNLAQRLDDLNGRRITYVLAIIKALREKNIKRAKEIALQQGDILFERRNKKNSKVSNNSPQENKFPCRSLVPVKSHNLYNRDIF